ncbi:MAG: ABC transporter C-terminal domain-containing protein [Treponemataceae bacterium]|nr:ABC transporter C-terminal domain-containing protein [Spirochaetales bacterium]MDY6030666.1 ABC transporter C-terminal domain-containing protein [Treponemataceae bacterium]
MESEIFELEARKEELEALMSGTNGDFSQLESATKEYNELTVTLDSKYNRWEELASISG